MEKNITREELFNECLIRMEMLNLSRQCINAFKKGKVWESENIGALYELNEEEEKIVKDFENENGGMVYHVIHNLTDFGELYTLLYTSKYKSEWKEDIEDLQNGYSLAYVYNKDYVDNSEFGSIAFRKNIGGLIRIG